MRAHWNTWGRVSQAQKSGYGIWWDGSCVAVGVSRAGMLTDAQVGQHDSTVHSQGFSCLKREADSHDVIRWCHCHFAYKEGWGLYKESIHKPQGSHLSFWLQYIQLHFMRSHRPSCSYLGACWGVRLQLYREVFFICSAVSGQGYLGHPELVYFSDLQASQVAHPMDPLKPVLEQQGPQSFSANWHMHDKLQLWWSH